MIETNQGAKVTIIKNNNKLLLPLPKKLGVKYRQKYVVQVKRNFVKIVKIIWKF